jgi:hypothetical protein
VVRAGSTCLVYENPSVPTPQTSLLRSILRPSYGWQRWRAILRTANRRIRSDLLLEAVLLLGGALTPCGKLHTYPPINAFVVHEGIFWGEQFTARTP